MTNDQTALEIIMTHPNARKHGYASALLAHISAIADKNYLPLYLDAEKDAIGLYVKHGYTHQYQVPQSSFMCPMKRVKKSEQKQ